MVTENINIVVTTRGARVAAQQIQGIGRSSRVASLAVRALGVALLTVGVGGGIRGLFRLSDAATEVGNRIRSVTGSTETYLSVQNRLFDVANKTGQTIENTSRLFQRLTVGTRDLGVGSARVVNVVEGLNAALLVSGSTAREAEAALLQLGQGLASDNLSGEELRSLRENLPQLAQELANQLGTSIGALKELGRQGRLTAEEVFPALERATQRFNEQLRNGDIVFTFANAFNAVRNAVLQFFSIIQRAGSATQSFNKAIFDFSDGLAERLVFALADAVDFIARLVDSWQAFKQVLGGFEPILSALGTGFAFLGKSAIVAIQAINFGFLVFLDTLAASNALLQKFLSFIGLASATDVAIADETAAKSAEDTNKAFENLGDTLSNFTTSSFTELATGIKNVGAEATAQGNFLRNAADALRNATVTPPESDDPPAPPPTFLERAFARADEVRAERGALERIDVPVDLAQGIRDSFGQGFAEAIKNGGNIFDLIATNLEEASANALINGFQQSFDSLQGLLEEAFVSAGDALQEILPDAIKGIGPVLGDVLSGAIQFVALQALSALLGGGGNEQRTSTGNVQSAVTSTQAVRGIVAGPTEVAIANVGRNIAEAVDPLLQETIVQTGILRGILAGVQNGVAASGGDTSDTAALAFGSAPVAAA